MAKIVLSWSNDSNIHSHQKIYKSLTVFDSNTLPSGAVTIGRDVRVYEDTDVVEGLTYYYAVATVGWNGVEYLSDVLEVEAVGGDGDPYWDKVVALLHFDDLDNPWKDETGRSWSTFGNTGSFTLTPGTGINGKAAVVLSAPAGGTKRCIRSPGVIPSGEIFTIEAFIKPTSTSSTFPIASQPVSGGNGDQVFSVQAVTGVLRYYKGSNSALIGPNIDAKGLDPVSDDSFSHAVLQFDGQNLEAYLDGVIQFSVSRPQGWINTANQFQIGNNAVPGYESYSGATDGIIDSMRVTVGIARYTGNFTPPTEPFPNYGV